MFNYTVYKHTTPNNKVYIGITCQTTKERWRDGKGYKNNIYFYKAICKYGWNNITHEILFFKLSKAEAEQKEIELIRQYKSTDRKFGYNVENGGNVCGTHSIETRQKISKALKGKQNCLGRKISQEHILRLAEGRKNAPKKPRCPISEEHKQKISLFNKGKVVSQSTKDKLSLLAKERLKDPKNNSMYGKHHTKETIEKIRKANAGRKPPLLAIQKTIERVSIPVIRISKNGEIKQYKSIKEAGNDIGKSPQNIGMCCKNNNRTCGGYHWEYAL